MAFSAVDESQVAFAYITVTTWQSCIRDEILLPAINASGTLLSFLIKVTTFLTKATPFAVMLVKLRIFKAFFRQLDILPHVRVDIVLPDIIENFLAFEATIHEKQPISFDCDQNCLLPSLGLERGVDEKSLPKSSASMVHPQVVQRSSYFRD